MKADGLVMNRLIKWIDDYDCHGWVRLCSLGAAAGMLMACALIGDAGLLFGVGMWISSAVLVPSPKTWRAFKASAPLKALKP